MIHLNRRNVFATAAGAMFGAAALMTLPATAAEYPDKPITMLVGYGAGGQTDLVARATAKVMSEKLGVPINVVNKPGAGGAVAGRDLQKAKPDGHTVLFHANTIVNTAPFIMKAVTFKPDDFEYAGMITAYQGALATQKDAPYNNLTEFIAWAKENPGLSYGSLSPAARMTMEEIAKAENLDVNIVPLQSGSEMINALLGKQVVLALSGGIHYRYPDELKSVSALTTFRHETAPDVPTIEEEGFELAMDTRTVLFLPKGTPRPILDRLAEALKAAETDPDFKKVTAAANIPIKYFGVDEAYAEMNDTYAKHKKIMEGAGVVPK